MDEYVHLDAEEMRRASNKLGVFLDRAALKRKVEFEPEFVLREVLQSINNYRVMKGTEG
ncbi:hypothetical protein [Mycobacteroides chelonae]|uniref:hypothetical protein n=1 Tax=Mycobacteroides chelonae TaxID=1774 RepID=UPI0013F4C092|nr:hypothetical protein [Mycobacteroides chelonae]